MHLLEMYETPTLIPFLKNKYMPLSEISSRSTFVIPSIVSELRASALK